MPDTANRPQRFANLVHVTVEHCVQSSMNVSIRRPASSSGKVGGADRIAGLRRERRGGLVEPLGNRLVAQLIQRGQSAADEIVT